MKMQSICNLLLLLLILMSGCGKKTEVKTIVPAQSQDVEEIDPQEFKQREDRLKQIELEQAELEKKNLKELADAKKALNELQDSFSNSRNQDMWDKVAIGETVKVKSETRTLTGDIVLIENEFNLDDVNEAYSRSIKPKNVAGNYILIPERTYVELLEKRDKMVRVKNLSTHRYGFEGWMKR